MAETWHASKDWPATDYVVTPTDMNEQVRDNIAYLKGVLTGSDLQDVTIHANKAFKHGAFFVHRRVTAAGHIESGSHNFGTLAAGAEGTYAVTFADAYASPPNIAVAGNGTTQDATDPTVLPYAGSITTTGFTLAVKNTGAATRDNVTVSWIADGPD